MAKICWNPGWATWNLQVVFARPNWGRDCPNLWKDSAGGEIIILNTYHQLCFLARILTIEVFPLSKRSQKLQEYLTRDNKSLDSISEQFEAGTEIVYVC